MKLVSASSFYRKPSPQNAKIEDGFFINVHVNIYGVTDGNSAAFSPSNPPLLYHGLTGGQMVNLVLGEKLSSIAHQVDLAKFLLLVNEELLLYHKTEGKDPTDGDDVGGACFSFCQPSQDGIQLILGGDSFIFLETKRGPLFFTGFDKEAFAIEERDQKKFTECKEKSGGNIGGAWDLYWPIYRNKRIACKNRNIGMGGDASLNGDPALENCWKKLLIPWDDEPKLVILGTDGVLPPTEVHPDKFHDLSYMISRLYGLDGIDSILSWRDSVEWEKASLTHIEGSPEAAIVILKFSA